MNLYLLSQTTEAKYDYYDSCIVAAKSEEDAKTIHPSGTDPWPTDVESRDEWVRDIAHVKVKHIGTAKEGTAKGVILASFNAA